MVTSLVASLWCRCILEPIGRWVKSKNGCHHLQRDLDFSPRRLSTIPHTTSMWHCHTLEVPDFVMYLQLKLMEEWKCCFGGTVEGTWISNSISLLNMLGFLICLKFTYFKIYIFQSCVRFVPKIAPSPVLS